MLLRALAAFLLLPGVVAFLLPIAIARATSAQLEASAVGVAVLLSGVVGLLWCVVAFYVNGRGTLAPWAPPKHLVTNGLYRYCRNPMYLAVLLVLLGWYAVFQSVTLAIYACAVAVAFHIRVVVVEEPWLARTHGVEWKQYEQSVPRWPWWPHPPRDTANDA